MAKVLRQSGMQRTIRALRIALPIVILGFVLLIVFSWTASKKRGTAQTEGVTSTQRPEDTAVVEGRSFEDVQTIGGRVVSRIRANRVVSFESGWTTLEGVELTLFRQNGLTYEVTCPQAQFNATTKEADAKGGVRVASSDGIEIKTAEIKYDGARLTNDIPVQFKVDRWNGDAGALDLDVQGETLRLFKKVTATMTAVQPGEIPMTIRGSESFFRRRENTVEFKEQVQMDRGNESVNANWMFGRFTQDRKQLIGVEGRENCVIVMAGTSSSGEDLGGRKEIHSDGFHTEVGPDGQINALNATSVTNLAHAILDGPPKRDITARAFRVALANRVVSEIRADTGVVMKELGETPREINAEHVTVWFDQATRRARNAYLEGAFRYKDPKTTATAFRANYDIVGDRIILTTDPGWQATVVTEGHTLKAKTLEFSPRAQTARASGSVIAQLISKGGTPSAENTTLFPAGKPVFVNSDELVMRQANKVAVFSGNVRAWQDNNTVLANELQVTGSGDSIIARGNVRSMLYNTSAEARKTPVQSTSEQLVARKADKRIDLLGKVTIVDETRNLKSEKAMFFFDERNKVQRIEAENAVTLFDSATNRKGTGEKAIYQVDKKMIYLNGSPATATDPVTSVSGQQIAFDLARNRVQVLSPDSQTKGTYKHEGS
ncbi:MAG TPA: LPS export ABC transporter periplasmic protein LptC [Thermoanaerobaculia bacterium]|nr:LPS export ABC transporter periplasmic protein LptC [Thermoanaerobaculia bacterium]